MLAVGPKAHIVLTSERGAESMRTFGLLGCIAHCIGSVIKVRIGHKLSDFPSFA